jgi:quinol monooxygenase YgiN
MDAVLTALAEMKQLVAASEPGCLLYQVSRSRDDSGVLLLVETYTDDEAMAAHRVTEHFARIIEGTVIPMLTRRAPEVYDVVV